MTGKYQQALAVAVRPPFAYDCLRWGFQMEHPNKKRKATFTNKMIWIPPIDTPAGARNVATAGAGLESPVIPLESMSTAVEKPRAQCNGHSCGEALPERARYHRRNCAHYRLRRSQDCVRPLALLHVSQGQGAAGDSQRSTQREALPDSIGAPTYDGRVLFTLQKAISNHRCDRNTRSSALYHGCRSRHTRLRFQRPTLK
jgi:hypothetical protein